MVFTGLNEWDPAWIIFLVVAAISGLFAFIAGILFAIAGSGVAGEPTRVLFIFYVCVWSNCNCLFSQPLLISSIS